LAAVHLGWFCRVHYHHFIVLFCEPAYGFAFYHFSRAPNVKELTKQKFSKIRAVNIKSLESHLVREDFEKWIAQTFGDAKLA